jgi:menaquinol-cytochrome c reductase cytochrome b/c subunit
MLSLTGIFMVYGSGVGADEPPAGKQAFDRVCKVCHGADGQGDAGPALVPMDREYEDVIAIVRDGTGQMPPIAPERVSDDEVKGIVSYLKSVKAPEKH